MKRKLKAIIIVFILLFISSCARSLDFRKDFLDYLNDSGYIEAFVDEGDGVYMSHGFYSNGNKECLIFLEEDFIMICWKYSSEMDDASDILNNGISYFTDNANKYAYEFETNSIYCNIDGLSEIDDINSEHLSSNLQEARKLICDFLNNLHFDYSNYIK